MKKLLLIVLAVILLAGCQTTSVTENTDQLSVESQTVSLEDESEYDLTADEVTKDFNGEKLSMMAYNGSIPGPTLKVKQGSEITINFKNNLEQATALHSHGLRLDNEFDGVPGVTQDEIKPGDSFTYKLKFPDSGIYFYHPHVREDVQQELGLYGAFIVEPKDGSKVTDQVIFLDDLEIGRNGNIEVSTDEVTHTLMGRFGNTMLTNGMFNYQYDVMQNTPTLLTFANVANVRPFNIAIEGSDMEMLGSDAGNFESPFQVDNFVIAPSERYTVQVSFKQPGTYEILNKTPNKDYVLGKINVTESGEATSLSAINENSFERSSVPNFESYLSKAPDKELTLSMEMQMMGMSSDNMMMNSGSMPCHDMGGGMMMGDCEPAMSEDSHDSSSKIEWEDEMQMMNAVSTKSNVQWELIDTQANLEGDDIDWEFNQGDYVKIRLFNDPNSAHPMQHPFHIHGQRFIVLLNNEVPNNNLVWKDTVLVPSGDTIDILVEISNPGKWVAHCHIPEHMEAGMMFDFTVN